VAEVDVQGIGTREQPWQLKTPSGTSEYQMYQVLWGLRSSPIACAIALSPLDMSIPPRGIQKARNGVRIREARPVKS